MVYCTEFCTKLSEIQVHNGLLPSHSEIIAQLPATGDDGGWPLGTWSQLLNRDKCAFCGLVVTAVTDSIDVKDNGGVDVDQTISVFLFPDEQSFRLSYPSLLGTRIAFLALTATNATGADTARLLSGHKISPSKLKEWLHTCDTEHTCRPGVPETRRNQNSEEPLEKKISGFNEDATSNFRVLDLELGCVKHVALDVRYVALSYVWGQLPMFQLRIDNIERLSQEGSLQDIRNELPRTILDAMDLVRAIGEQYLWVDGLCLVQDDPGDLALGISMMNSIYQGSYLTIAAGSGVDAHAGLPGFTEAVKRDRKQVIRQVAPGIQMTILHSIDWHLSRSIYNERGWTLQELVLPHRTIIFINGQMYFRCKEANWSEETWADKWAQWLDADDSNISRVPDPVDGFLPSLWAYQKLCEEFSRRKLRNDGDALRALAGITRPMAAGMESLIVEGLPGYYLDHFLLFISSNGEMRRRDRFASFSWAGWEGRILWPRENFEWYDTKENGILEKVRETENILKHLRHNRVLEWVAVDITSGAENLSFRSWDRPSLLLEVMERFPSVFPPDERENDPLKDTRYHGHRMYSSGSLSASGLPHWDPYSSPSPFGQERSPLEVRKAGPLPPFSLRVFDLANSRAEFARLVARISASREKLAIYNWMACRHLAERRAIESRTAIGPRLQSRSDRRGLNYFREARDSVVVNGGQDSKRRDRRAENGREWVRRRKETDPDFIEDSSIISNFPPYTVLHIVTISLHLNLGVAPQDHSRTSQSSATTSPFDRIPGIPLTSKSGKLVGSLHPDNIHMLPPPSTPLELLIITRSQIPTIGSALFGLEDSSTERPWELFWFMHVVWKDGIAERRGVGQVLYAALEDAAEPKPCIKSVLLG